jgi:hypothetical protein
VSVLKEQAEVLRIGLVAGVRTTRDAVTWADGLIAAQSQPDLSLLNVSLAGSRSAAEMSTLLDEVPGDCDRVEVMRGILADLLHLLEREPQRADDIARWLYLWSVNGDLPDPPFGWEANALDDTFDLARRTIIPREEAMRQLLVFLRRGSQPAT